MNYIELLGLNDFVTWCDYIGTFAFAISGTRHAASKGFDWFGAYVVGMVTAVGGGTLRDILLNMPPFWLKQPSYLVVTGLALLFTIIFRKQVVKANYSLSFFDAVGLGLFVVVGMAKTLDAQYAWWCAIIMATITGSLDFPQRFLCFCVYIRGIYLYASSVVYTAEARRDTVSLGFLCRSFACRGCNMGYGYSEL